MSKPLKAYTPHYGSSRFSDYVEKRYLLVDKTLFVKHFLECPASVSLITRPRRWGKTFNLSILEYFFSIPVDSQGQVDQKILEKKRQVFSTFKIGQETEYMENFLGNYPVVFITLKKVNGKNYTEWMNQIGQVVGEAYEKHQYLLQSPKLDSDQKAQFLAYQRGKAPLSDLPQSLKFLMKLLFLHFGQRCILLIDEYDTPFNLQFAQKILREKNTLELFVDPASLEKQKKQDEDLQDLLGFFRSFLGESLKGNEDYLERATVTGILRIARANLFSDVNNLGEFSILNADDFAEDFGFLEEEISVLLDQLWSGTPEKKDQKQSWLDGAKAWYNGYQICDLAMYNPWSILNWLSRKGKLAPYWSQTSSDHLLKVALFEGVPENTVKTLLLGEWLPVSLRWEIAFADFQNPSLNEALVWTLLSSSGYLTIRSKGNGYEVRVPNHEVMAQVEGLFEPQITRVLGQKNQYEPWIQGLSQGRVEAFCEGMKAGLRETSSFHHTKKDLEDLAETFYHGLALGMFIALRQRFILESERESGEGRLDLILIGRPGIPIGYLFELKAGKAGEDLENLVQQGFKQIRKKDYTRKFSEYPHIKTVREVSIAFCGKEMEYASRLMGTTTEEEIRALAGEYFSKDWDEMMKKMVQAIQKATLQGDFKVVKNLSDRVEKLQTLSTNLKKLL